MPMRTSISLSVLVGCLFGTATSTSPSDEFAAPRIIMFHSGVLSEPAFMTDWEGILQFLSQTYRGAPVQTSTLSDRPYAEVAFFWHGPTWESYASDPDRLKTLKPEQALKTCPFEAAACYGRYYPAHGGAPPVLDFYNGSDHAVTAIPQGAQVFLERAHVPLRMGSE